MTILEHTEHDRDYWRERAEAWHGLLAEADKANGRLIVELAEARADAAALRAAIRHYTTADSLDERLRGWDILCQLG